MTSSHSVSPSDLEALFERVSHGLPLSVDALAALAASPDILPLGMLADAVRRRVCGTRVTYVRVALVDVESSVDPASVPALAQELRLTGSPESLELAVGRVAALRKVGGDKTISGFSWLDIERWAAAHGGHAKVLVALRDAGLDAVAELPIDLDESPERALACLGEAGIGGIRLTVGTASSTPERMRHLLRAAACAGAASHVAAVAPLPLSLNPLRPTTGYDDVKAVALARLAMPEVPHVQVDWLRYGPKLAQVALTFGADDFDNVSASDEAPDGRRRATIEELRKNVESAGFTAVERTGRFAPLAV